MLAGGCVSYVCGKSISCDKKDNNNIIMIIIIMQTIIRYMYCIM